MKNPRGCCAQPRATAGESHRNRRWFGGLIAVLCGLGVVLPGIAQAQAREQASLGDLQIPASRVPVWRPLDHLPLDTSGWRVQPVPCGSHMNIVNAINSATPNTVLQLPANCTYVIPSGTINLNRSRVVLRGAPDLSSVLEFQHTDQAGILVGLRGYPPNQVFGNGRAWTGGFHLGDQVLTLAHTNGLQVGDWVRLLANSEPDWHSRARNGYSAKLTCVGTTGSHPACQSLSSNQVRLDRPLNSEFTQGGTILEQATGNFVEYAGIERVRIQHQTPERIESYRSRITFEDCHECWLTDSSLGDAGNAHVTMGDVARILIRGNRFGSNQCTDEGQRCNWNKGAVYYNDHTYDTVFENNVLVDTPSGPLLQNGGGNVVAYNYMTANPSVECERHVFLHGQGVRASLIEGNDVSCMIEWDSYRDGQGYYNMIYRNRLRGTPSTGQSFGGYYRGRLGGEMQGSFIHRFITVIGNHVNELMGGPFPNGLGIDFSSDSTHQHRDTWVSYNISRSAQQFDDRAVRTTRLENYVGNGPRSSWSSMTFPASMYRTDPPSWWCEESGPFPNIGAPSDRVGSYGRLPAQIRLEGGPCTPVGGFPAPHFLPNS